MNEEHYQPDELIAPHWFIRFITGATAFVLAVGIPWASWQTYTLIVMTQQYSHLNGHYDLALKRIEKLEIDTISHSTQLQVVAATRFTSDDARLLVRSLEDRLGRLEDKLDRVQDDITQNLKEAGKAHTQSHKVP